VIPALIRKTIDAISNNHRELIVAGSGKPLRQFIFSRDLARLIIWALWEYNDIEPIILSPPESQEISISTVAEHITRICRFKGSIKYDHTRADGQFKKTASNRKLESLYPLFKFTPFEDALIETIEWFSEHNASARLASRT
jgi:GDP-L-fucose synthase